MMRKVTMRGVQAAALAAAGMLAALAPAQAALAGTTARTGRTQAAFHLPYTDPNQAGWLTLCGTNLKPVTHGSIKTAPFVWRVVSDVPPPQGYFIKGAKAQMFAYQPRPYTPAGAWSGTVMGAASYYSSRTHPMAQFTPIDSPLTQMTLAFPPIWEHLIELRLYLGGPGLTEYVDHYAAADIQVSGNSWTLVAGGHSSCTDGKVVSVETVVGMPGASGTPKPSSTSANGTGGSGSPGAQPSAGTSAGSGQPPGGQLAANTTTDSSSSAGGVALAVVIVLVAVIGVLATGSVWWRRRRRATG
ncbi:MAG TPA: hypothetical protein VF834_11425 [Streptosporangiaceae bacterium]